MAFLPILTAEMPARLRRSVWIVCLGVAWSGVAWPATAPAPRAANSATSAAKTKAKVKAKATLARQLMAAGSYDEALVAIDEGLALAPGDLSLLALRGSVLMAQHDLAGALAAYRAYLAAGATGAKKRQVEALVKELRPLDTTFLEINVPKGPAQIYLPVIGKAALCVAAPPSSRPAPPQTGAGCAHVAILPRSYQIIAERPGFERWTGRVAVVPDRTTTVQIDLVELPSALTVRATPEGSAISVDDAPFQSPGKVAAGSHQIKISAAGHAETIRKVTAHEGQPLEIDVSLTPLVPIRVSPPNAALTLDGTAIASREGRMEMPPGPHRLIARAGGFHDGVVEIPSERASDYHIGLDLAPVVVAAPPPPPPPKPSMWTVRRKIAVGSAAVGAAALAAGIVRGLQARQLDRETYTLCASPEMPCQNAAAANDHNTQARSDAFEANLAFGIAGAAAAAAAYLWFTGGERPAAEVAPRVGASSGLDLSLRF
jgi:hypothetical protein